MSARFRSSLSARSLLLASIILAGATHSPAYALCVANPMSGRWVTTNPSTRFLTRAHVEVGCCDQILNGELHCSPPDSVRLFGKCHPTDCDWGARTGRFTNAAGTQMNMSYNQSFARRDVRISPSGENLRVRVITNFRDPSRRDYTRTELMRRE
jgi:hypothetical protein